MESQPCVIESPIKSIFVSKVWGVTVAPSSSSIYSRTPILCFWAISQEKYEHDPRCTGELKGYEFNVFIRDESIRVRKHYAASTTTVIQL